MILPLKKRIQKIHVLEVTNGLDLIIASGLSRIAMLIGKQPFQTREVSQVRERDLCIKTLSIEHNLYRPFLDWYGYDEYIANHPSLNEDQMIENQPECMEILGESWFGDPGEFCIANFARPSL